MKLSSLIRQEHCHRKTPTWLWHAVRKRDLPWITAEGILFRPHIWLAGTRKAAIGFYPDKDRLILRVCVSALTRDKLVRDRTWQRWLTKLKQGKLRPPPASLAAYWASLRRRTEPEVANRLKTGAVSCLRDDLRVQIARVRPDQLWRYSGRILPEALSRLNEAGFYVSVKPVKGDYDVDE